MFINNKRMEFGDFTTKYSFKIEKAASLEAALFTYSVITLK